jgi:hypothetical protein
VRLPTAATPPAPAVEDATTATTEIDDTITPITDAIPTAQCVVCGAVCDQTGAEGIFEHPQGATCVAILVDENGESLDRQYFIADDGMIYEITPPAEEQPPVPTDDVIGETPEESYEDDQLPVLPDAPPPPKSRKRKAAAPTPAPAPALPAGASVTDAGMLMIPTERDPNILALDEGLLKVFDKYQLPRLGGASGDLGWSSFSTFQKCPYLFKRLYVDGLRDEGGRPPRYIEIGSAMHTFLAVYYQKLIDPNYQLTPDLMNKELLDLGCDAEVLLEAWRLWSGYSLFYEQDFIQPLAVEYHVVDPNTRESARYDLIAKIEKADSRFKPGTYIVEHKTASRFDTGTTDGWQNDGEVIGQMMLWNRLKLTKKFGKLAGVMMNIIGKQRQQKFHRTLVVPQRWQINQHGKDLRMWQGIRQMIMAMGTYPRSRANCIHRYGMCSQWEHCAHRE